MCDPRHRAFSGATSCCNNTAELAGFAEGIRWAYCFISRGARFRILYDSKHVVCVTIGVVRVWRNIALVRICNELLFQLKCNIHVSAHVFGHAGDAGDECVDTAASLGMTGVSSENNVPKFWSKRVFSVQRLFEIPHRISRFAEVLHSFVVRHQLSSLFLPFSCFFRCVRMLLSPYSKAVCCSPPSLSSFGQSLFSEAISAATFS